MVQLHRTEIDTDARASMKAQDRIELATGQKIVFEPGGYHIMLMNLTHPLAPGDTFELTLLFEKDYSR